MQRIIKDDFSRRQWARLINSISGFKSANMVGTVSNDGGTNLCIVSSVVHLGAKPPLLAFVLRPHSNKTPRHTLLNIEATKVYTLNMVTEDIYKKAHQSSAKYGREISEFAKVGLKEKFIAPCPSPFVKESPLQIEMALKEIMPIKHNGTHFVIGEVKNIYVEPTALEIDGYLDIEALKAVCISGLDSYHVSQRLARLSYAEPDLAVSELTVSAD